MMEERTYRAEDAIGELAERLTKATCEVDRLEGELRRLRERAGFVVAHWQTNSLDTIAGRVCLDALRECVEEEEAG